MLGRDSSFRREMFALGELLGTVSKKINDTGMMMCLLLFMPPMLRSLPFFGSWVNLEKRGKMHVGMSLVHQWACAQSYGAPHMFLWLDIGKVTRN